MFVTCVNAGPVQVDPFGSLDGNDVLDGGTGIEHVGGGGDDGLFGGTGNDKLWGDDQNETLLAGPCHGNDYLDGGADDDGHIQWWKLNGLMNQSVTRLYN